MKRCLEVLINKVFKKDLELMFGKNSHVIINYCKYSTNNLSFVVDCKVMVSDIELTKDAYPYGLVFLVEDSWKFVGIDKKVTVITSIDII